MHSLANLSFGVCRANALAGDFIGCFRGGSDKKFYGRRHNVAQEVPEHFVKAVVEVDGQIERPLRGTGGKRYDSFCFVYSNEDCVSPDSAIDFDHRAIARSSDHRNSGAGNRNCGSATRDEASPDPARGRFCHARA